MRELAVGALWDCVLRVCGGGGGCAGVPAAVCGVPLGAGPWCCPDVDGEVGGVSRGYTIIIERERGRRQAQGTDRAQQQQRRERASFELVS